jgi:hypothetical protein
VQDDLDDTIARGSLPRVAAEAARAPDDDDTILVGRTAAASRTPPPVPAATPAGPHALVEPTVLTARATVPAATELGRIPDTPDLTPFVGLGTPTAAHYGFRIADTVVSLDRAAYVGRNPTRPRVLHDGLPRLVQVPSSGKEVSSTHVEIRQRGTSVVVTDLRSTNGTIVNIPGGTPTKLRQGESMVVTPGTLVDIGDGNLIEILPIHRR